MRNIYKIFTNHINYALREYLLSNVSCLITRDYRLKLIKNYTQTKEKIYINFSKFDIRNKTRKLSGIL